MCIRDSLWRDISHKMEAAEALKLTANDLHGLGLVDEIVPEPPGGAQNDYGLAADAAGAAVRRHLAAVRGIPVPRLLEQRYERYRRIGLSQEQLPQPGLKTVRRARPA